ncbi:Putative hydrolase [Ignavibacterium album JCM 16511]|uniref:CRISPR system single-strand-specific deoxyribonuclease Cas10/Csm1 (subtype III-A) n=1 Tax=Ignavibacterium album (strain DSM 19864 / JCM 16511 / NBRC 101810 / Mat9-16) TaxID=945713 RepID=I0AIU7_IGNAJ|nr:type III-A CRISPR-associated protein Cas10/Csm1 [Ignavibacterium album]AFH48904.1 Putative hydrolase [Ignavibacterium album JCM 16511]
MTAEEKTLILGALFHDIGKFKQRGVSQSERLKHQEYSSGFVNDLFKDKLLSDLVLYHHREDLNKSNLSGLNRILAEIVCEADNLASGERQPDPDVKTQHPLESILSKIDGVHKKKINPQLYFQDISELFYNEYIFPIKKDKYDLSSLENKYKAWWNKFEKEIKKVNKDEIETLFYLLKKYLWCVPSSSYKTRSDVSLFEHSKITAAIAISMLRFLLEKNGNDINKLKDFDNREEYRYQLVLGDITGIQSYIYNIGHRGAAKSLKGRSFFLQQMLENIAYYILDHKSIDLPITNLIYSSGGKFYLFVPNTNSVNNALEQIQKELEQKFLYDYNGALGIIFGKIELNGRDLEYNKDGKDHTISEKWDKLNSIVEIQKKRKFSKNWFYSFFEPSGIDGEIIKCSYTGIPLIKKEVLTNKQTLKQEVKLDEYSPVKFIKHSFEGELFYQVYDNENLTDDYISKEQFYSQKIGNDLKKNFETIVYQDVLEGYSVLDINSFTTSKDFNFVNKLNSKYPRQFLINSLKINDLQGDASKGYKFYGGDWRFGDTYEEVIKKGLGIERLGVLRLDVDNLGLIFKDGFGKHATFGRVVQLSSMLDFFFSHYLNKLKFFSWNPVKGLSEKISDYNYKVKDLIEIVYSGGDDVFIVGHWSVLPDVAIWINEEFRKFTANNDNFSISAGISLFDDKYPIYKAALEAGEYEDLAKRKERINKDKSKQKKNGICFLDKKTPVSWNDFDEIRSWVRKFYNWLEVGVEISKEEKKKLSKGLISRLYSIYYEYEEGKYQDWARWRWRASYSLARLAKQYQEPFGDNIRDFAAELFTSKKTKQELIQLLYIIANWTDLLTRKENKNDK